MTAALRASDAGRALFPRRELREAARPWAVWTNAHVQPAPGSGEDEDGDRELTTRRRLFYHHLSQRLS